MVLPMSRDCKVILNKGGVNLLPHGRIAYISPVGDYRARRVNLAIGLILLFLLLLT